MSSSEPESEPSAAASASATPTATPTATPLATPTATPSATPTATPLATPSASQSATSLSKCAGHALPAPTPPEGCGSSFGGGGSQGGASSSNVPMAAPSRQKHSVHWFRKGLRLHDNPSLREGLRGATTLRCVFILDPWFAGSSNVGINKWRFLLQCLEDLDRSLRKFNSRLFVIRGQPADALPKLFKEWGTTNLTFEEDPEPFGRVRDQNIMTMCKELSISVVSMVSHTLYELEKIIEKNGAKPPLTYHQFQNVVASMDLPPQAKPTITGSNMQNCFTPIADDHDDKYGVPTLEELGFDTEGLKPAVWIGGETEALARLEHHLERKAWVASFGRPKMTPQSLLPSQTGLSPYLRFGCLSTRLFYYQLTDLYKKIKKAVPPLSLHGQLLWREFFYCAATRNPFFDKMVGNPICVQIPWDHNAEAIAKWANGQTGFPWIDAIMTQLREEGWIHHLARHAVACFLTRGDLWISWEEGMKVFEELLLDADWSVNAGMWMWLSCSSFFQQFFHCYCPVRFGRKADPNGDYIRRYLPVLKNFPTRFIHEPWIAPESVQRSAKCIVGKDYPKPMVNHGMASRINIERMKQVYTQLSKYRGSGTGAGSSLLREQLRLLATVPNSMPMSFLPKKPQSPLGSHASVYDQVEDGSNQEPQQQQQQQQHQQPAKQQQFQQFSQQYQHPQTQHELGQQPQLHLFPSHSHQHLFQHQSPISSAKVDSHLMAPPKSPYQSPLAQSSQVCKMQILQLVSHQQVLDAHQNSSMQQQQIHQQSHPQQMSTLHVHSQHMGSSSHNNQLVQHQVHNIPQQMKSYQMEVPHQNFASEHMEEGDENQHQWAKENSWQEFNSEFKELKHERDNVSETDDRGIVGNYNHDADLDNGLA